jgi:hypothetical protein
MHRGMSAGRRPFQDTQDLTYGVGWMSRVQCGPSELQGMLTNPALKDVAVREYGVLDPPTAITAAVPAASGLGGPR